MVLNHHLKQLLQEIAPFKAQLLNHEVYARIQNTEDLKIFMQYHVFAVWDFMSLLKSLQIQLTCVTIPWIPIGDASTRTLINEIVMGEESDVDAHGMQLSHFEMYMDAMEETGADTQKIKTFIAHIQSGMGVVEALALTEVPAQVIAFVKNTFASIAQKPVFQQASAFTFGREDLIPGMFISFVDELNAQKSESIAKFNYYLKRHIEVDGDHHSHLAHQMMIKLCGTDTQKWQEATQEAIHALKMRMQLWDAIKDQISS